MSSRAAGGSALLSAAARRIASRSGGCGELDGLLILCFRRPTWPRFPSRSNIGSSRAHWCRLHRNAGCVPGVAAGKCWWRRRRGGHGGGGHGGGGGKSGGQEVSLCRTRRASFPRPAVKSGCGAWDVRVAENGTVTVTPAAASEVTAPCGGPIQPTVAGRASFTAASREVQIRSRSRTLGSTACTRRLLSSAQSGVSSQSVAVPAPQSYSSWGLIPQLPIPSRDRGRKHSGSSISFSAPGSPPLTAEMEQRCWRLVRPRHPTLLPCGGYGARRLGLPAQPIGYRHLRLHRSGAACHSPLHRGDGGFAGAAPTTSSPATRIFPVVSCETSCGFSFATMRRRNNARRPFDLVDGVVIGGMTRGNDRYYYVRFAANPDSGAIPLGRAIRALAALPQVRECAG